ncbi:MAG: 50S ribosomal protein L9 [Chloroflexales bacterium]|nr:50S ribosomal protein L9 [Chloroflexales bacterium]
MKVLLTQDIEKLGQAGEIKEVAGGFGRNYLVPKGLAVLATPGQIRQAEERIQARRRREEADRRDAEELAARIGGVTLRFTARVGALDRLYGSVTNVDIANKLSEQVGIEVDRRKIDLTDPIKRIGIYPVKVRLMAGLEPIVNVVVEAGDTTDEAALSDAEPEPQA